MQNNFDHLPALIIFARVVQLGSMSEASRQLNISRSAVSKQVAKLEKRLGMRLLNRNTRQLSLTEAGDNLLSEAVNIANSMETITRLGEDLQGQIKGLLRITCTTGLGRARLVPLLPEFNQRYPKIRIQLMLEDRNVNLVDEQVDVAIRIGNLPDSSLVARHLGDLCWKLAASPKYLARRGTPHTPNDLTDHDCLFYRNKTNSMDTWSFNGEQGVESVQINGPLSMNDASALVTATEAGMGILLVDQNMLTQSIAAGTLVPVLPTFSLTPGLPVYALYPARKYLSAKTRVFVEFLLERLSPELDTTCEVV